MKPHRSLVLDPPGHFGRRGEASGLLRGAILKLVKYGTYAQPMGFLLESNTFKLKARMPSSESAMNIFYIIGVVVVIIVVAGFLGVHL